MPHAIRKGIAAAERERESKRRSEARENGIVLERQADRARGLGKGMDVQRIRRPGRGRGAVDMPGMGKMRGAELKISKREARTMESHERDERGPRNRRSGGRGKRS
jgi:hypothetical protein